jgi:hypothetical protein
MVDAKTGSVVLDAHSAGIVRRAALKAGVEHVDKAWAASPTDQCLMAVAHHNNITRARSSGEVLECSTPSLTDNRGIEKFVRGRVECVK